MRCTVREAKRRYTWREFRERQVFESIEPLGEMRMDLRNAMVCELLASAIWVQGGGKGKQPCVEDFLVDWWSERRTAKKMDEMEIQDAILLSVGVTQQQIDESRNGHDRNIKHNHTG